jgi:hypothetical protein
MSRIDELPYAHDGWQARLRELPATGCLQIVMTLRYRGETASESLVWSVAPITAESRGKASRMLLLWAGIAEYLNSGGDPYELPSVASVASELPSFELAGYTLLNTQYVDGYRIHTFQCDADPQRVLSWQEGVICEELTASQLGDYLTALDEIDDREDLLDPEGLGPQEQNLLEP